MPDYFGRSGRQWCPSVCLGADVLRRRISDVAPTRRLGGLGCPCLQTAIVIAGRRAAVRTKSLELDRGPRAFAGSCQQLVAN